METTTVLNCVMYGAPNEQFGIDIALGKPISILKDYIQQKMPEYFEKVNVARIRPFKLKVPLADDDSLPEKLAALDIKEQEELSKSTARLSTFFTLPPQEGHVHVIVLPPTERGKRERTPSATTQDQLKRAKMAQGPIPPKAKDHFQHFHQLWEDLWHAPQGSPIPYVKRVRVERDNTLIDDKIKVNDEVWILQVSEEVARGVGLPPGGILLRDEIFEAVQFLMVKCAPDQKLTWRKEAPANGLVENPELPGGTEDPGVIVTGQPGIGKSTLLWVLFVLLLHAQWPVVFQYRHDFVVLANELDADFGSVASREVESFIETYSQEGRRVVVLVDSTQEMHAPPSVYYTTRLPLFLVFTPSPRKKRIEWQRKAPQNDFYILDTWNLEDLLAARFLQSKAPPESNIVQLFEKFRPSAHDVYSYTIERYTAEVKAVVASLSWETLNSIVGNAGQRNYATISHFLLTMHPASGDTDTTLVRNKQELRIDGPEVISLLYEHLKLQQDSNADAFYQICVRYPSTKTMAGFLLDDRIHGIFPAGGTWPLRLLPNKSPSKRNQKFQHYASTNSTAATMYLHIDSSGFRIDNNPTSTGRGASSRMKKLDALREPLESAYYQPPQNTPTYDAFMYDAETKQVLLFQATVGKTHSLKVKGIRELTAKTQNPKVTYVLVTPDMEEVNLSVDLDALSMIETIYHIVLRNILPQQAT